jgi:predicted phosphodiesterase
MKKPIALLLTDTHLKAENLETNISIYKQAIEIAKRFGFTEIHHLGDIFDSRKSQTQLILTTFKDILDNFLAEGIKLRSIKGNHDCTEYSISKSFLEPFAHHPAFELYPISHTSSSNYCKDVDIHYLSHFSEEVYIQELLDLKKAINPDKKTVLFTHTDVNGGKMNNNTTIHNRITTDLFAEYDLVCIGHWHDMQIMDGGRIKFISASVQHNYGEATGKGCTILYNDLSTEIIPLKYPQYIKYEVKPSEITKKDIDDLKVEKEQSGDNIRVVLVGNDKELKSFNKQHLENAGISVQHKADEISKEVLQSRIEPFDVKSLSKEFDNFCLKNNLDKEQGYKYFKAIIE